MVKYLISRELERHWRLLDSRGEISKYSSLHILVHILSSARFHVSDLLIHPTQILPMEKNWASQKCLLSLASFTKLTLMLWNIVFQMLFSLLFTNSVFLQFSFIMVQSNSGASQVALVVKNAACQCRRHKRCSFHPWIRRIPCRRAWPPTPAFLPEESPWREEPGGLQSIALQSRTILKQLSMHA